MSRVSRGRGSTLLLAAMAIIFTIALCVYPKQGFEAGMSGLKVFWDVVFPSLLPFFILSELLLGLGVVRGFGVLLEPLMRPLFSVPGVGAFALSMGLAAGYPMDAVITARFRETGQCSRIEGERLLAFTNTADPLFMFGAVAVGMLKSPALGGLIALAHYISSFLVGVFFKFWGRKEERLNKQQASVSVHTEQQTNPSSPRPFILKRAYQAMLEAHEEDGRPFGKLLGNSVTESIQTLLMICGFIVFFAVLIEILHLSGLMTLIGWPLMYVFHFFGLNTGLVHPMLAGVLELDIGSAQAAAVAAPMIQKLAVISGIIAWSGLAVHAQVASVLTQTDIRMKPYFLARLLHAVLAALITVILFKAGLAKEVGPAIANISPAFAMWTHSTTSESSTMPYWSLAWKNLHIWVLSLVIMLFAAFAFLGWQRRQING
ncbi:sporulation integral membrane protein YlbJ [Alicyclobacillus tolerans]|uniref:sporulation integral membrane protein YlbJ n=1 Tax=Alicyclobacillus tolerans TaxID=90970 RepID=UPI003B78FDA8